jgi:hypothetical protein
MLKQLSLYFNMMIAAKAGPINLDKDWSSLSSEASNDMVAMVIETTLYYGKTTYQCFSDPSIDFKAPPLVVDSLDELSCISKFQFHKEHL